MLEDTSDYGSEERGSIPLRPAGKIVAAGSLGTLLMCFA